MPRPFALPGTRTNFISDRPARLDHVRLDWDLDLEGARLSGVAELTLTVRRGGLTAITLDAVELDVTSVTLDGREVAFDNDGERLRIACPQPPPEGTTLMAAIHYACRPRRGLYFILPDAEHPERPAQCWTQGQDDDSRYFWPCIDQPIEKFTTEVLCTAPAGVFVLSNGVLAARDARPDGRTRWHYKLDFPHPAYLVTLVAGPFAEVAARATGSSVDVF